MKFFKKLKNLFKVEIVKDRLELFSIERENILTIFKNAINNLESLSKEEREYLIKLEEEKKLIESRIDLTNKSIELTTRIQNKINDIMS